MEFCQSEKVGTLLLGKICPQIVTRPWLSELRKITDKLLHFGRMFS